MTEEQTFTRGQTLDIVLELPADVPTNYFTGAGVVTTLKADLRRLQNAGLGGLIAHLDVSWEPGSNFTQVRVLAQNTESWALGPAEFDVVFTKTTTADSVTTTRTLRSQLVQFTIQDGATR